MPRPESLLRTIALAGSTLTTLLLAATAPKAQSAPGEATPDVAAEVDAAVHRTRMRAAAAGLAWLAGQQRPQGCWAGAVGHKRGDDYLVLATAAELEAEGQGHMGVTAMAGLAFLAGGHLPDRGEYGRVVRRTLDYVLAHVNENGYVSDGGTRMYSHAFATLFLAQVCGTTSDRSVRPALERAVHWIVDCQNAQGAWRYNPFTPEADLSVTVCQLQALRAARNIGLDVPWAPMQKATEYVRRSQVQGGYEAGLFSYKIKGRGAFEKNREFAINAAAVTSLHSAGIHDDALLRPALDFLEREYPRVAEYWHDHYYYWYGNYYAAQALFQAGEQRFAAYHRRVCDDLLRWQQSDGRWIGRVGPGDAFSTAVACMLLQIECQYLPIFQR